MNYPGQPTQLSRDVADNFAHGSKAVGVGPVQLAPSTTPLTRGVQLKSATDNAGTIYVGRDNNLTPGTNAATDGFPLAADEGLFLPVDDASKVWLKASEANQKMFFFYL